MERNNKRPQNQLPRITNGDNAPELYVGHAERESPELAEDGTSVMDDSLEAPPEARVVAREIAVVLEAVRGDATWVDIEAIADRMLDPRNSVALSRRFYYNQIGADEEAWLDPKDIEATVHPQVKA